jgi:hypothetical protein
MRHKIKHGVRRCKGGAGFVLALAPARANISGMLPRVFLRWLLLTLAILLIATASGYWFARTRAAANNLATIRSLNLTQDDEEQEANDVSPAQVEQYVKVYESMQRDRNLTVDQATARQHLTVDEFRGIEQKIERDGVLRERVRRELLKIAQQKSNALKLKPQSAPSSTER